MTPTATPAVSISDISVRYGSVSALEHVDLHIPRGRVVGLVGMNGSGKSTLFSAIIGLVTPESGTVRVFGQDNRQARKKNQIAFVPQTEAIDRDFPISVREVVMLGRYGRLGFTRRPRAADHAAVDTALARVGLSDLADRQIGALSGGQRKRTFVARGIAQDASLLLLDEPFAGVDTTSQAMITALLRELRAEGRSLLVSTHDLAGIPELCDEVVLLNRRVLFQGPPAEALLPENLVLTFGVTP
ncbi:metal ABC transporter ATP-binding protein [Mycetocola spongiae]|uniref:metal ABC transporter ATP-binding protein n=1 Tax=Mycetocola spongiae TaxID=2859226 RepID=UPI001CF523BF|nr:metal ABC transporter ATP-binding protein [Mycetocola spongiae]UCR88370.1 metal ABC transporter ATP-binding protein [Mycetocola spongiae]